MAYRPMPDQAYLVACLAYDPETGIFTSRNSGKIIHCIAAKGYLRIRVNGINFLAHRIAFKIMTGREPNDQIDHINAVKNDNRWRNLREADNKQNHRNMPRSRANTTGYKGVSKCREKYRASIMIDGKPIHIGVFDTPQTTHDAYCSFAKEHFGTFWNAGMS